MNNKRLNKKLTEIAGIKLTASIHDNGQNSELNLKSDAEGISLKGLNDLKVFLNVKDEDLIVKGYGQIIEAEFFYEENNWVGIEVKNVDMDLLNKKVALAQKK